MSAVVTHLRRHCIGYVALFVALSGSAYAAVRLPANSVGTHQLRKNAVTSAKVKNHSLSITDLAQSSRAALKGPKGDAGPPGTPGAKGDTGATGPSETTSIRNDSDVAIPASSITFTTVATLPLPPGDYELLGEAALSTTTGTTAGSCRIFDGDTKFSILGGASNISGSFDTISVQWARHVTSGAAKLECVLFSQAGIARGAELTAIKVGSLSKTGEP